MGRNYRLKRRVMKEIIKELTVALEKCCIVDKNCTADNLIAYLEESHFSWIADLPISVVHQKEKLKVSGANDYLQAAHFFNEAGFSQTEYDLAALQSHCRVAKSAFQTVDLAVVEHGAEMCRLLFESKRPNDFWKRLKSVDAVKAMAGIECVDAAECIDAAIERELEESENGQWQIESRLRDAMRSKKENTDLRNKPFVWIVVKEQGEREAVDHIAMMLQHYFGANLVLGHCNADYYIGYMDELNAVSLREFYKKS
jgi:hypothetical protein